MSEIFHIQNGLTQREVMSPLLQHVMLRSKKI